MESYREVKQKSNEIYDEIDLIQLKFSILNNKKLITIITAASILLSGFYLFNKKNIWKGEFQIVLTESSVSRDNQFALSGNAIKSLINFSQSNNELKTELEILKSPSILMPTYQFIKDAKSKSGEDVSRWSFVDWLDKNVSVELQKDTTVLNFSYIDTDKDLIIPVLNEITNTYQKYSDRDRVKGIEVGINYLNDQISLFKAKTLKSSKDAIKYAIENDLSYTDGISESEGNNQSKNIEAVRVEAANAIRIVNEKLNQLKTLRNDKEQILFLEKRISELSQKEKPDLLKRIYNIEIELELLRSRYKEDDISIKRLIQQRSPLIKYLNKEVYGYLNAEKALLIAKEAATKRPKDVLMKYRELLREATLDERTLQKLETDKQLLSLEQAKSKDPWELITNPTLLDKPIGPKRLKTIAISGILGLFISVLISFIREKRKGLIYSQDELEFILNLPILTNLSLKDKDKDSNQILSLLGEKIIKESSNRSISLIPLGLVPVKVLDLIKVNLKNHFKEDVIITKDFLQAKNIGKQILIAQLGNFKRSEAIKFKNMLDLQNLPSEGIIILEAILE